MKQCSSQIEEFEAGRVKVEQQRIRTRVVGTKRLTVEGPDTLEARPESLTLAAPHARLNPDVGAFVAARQGPPTADPALPGW